VDPRKTDLTPLSSLYVPISPNKDCEWINSLAAILWKKFGHDTAFIERFTEGFGPYSDALSSFNPERLCLSTGTDMASLERAAKLLKGKKIALIVGHGITQQRSGARTMEALLNLSLMTGSMGSQAGGLYVIAKESNEVGAWDMGTVPNALPGRQPLGNAEARKEWEQSWKVKISPDQGLDLIRMIEESEKGNLKALYIMGENPIRSLPQGDRVMQAMEKLDFLVVQDILHNETTRIADVVLPGAAFCEKDGSFTNMEGRIQCFSQVVPAPGESKPDWEILDLLATRMGHEKRYGSLDKIRAEMTRSIALYADLKENTGTGFSWIRETSKRRVFSPNGEGTMIPFSSLRPMETEVADDEYPFTAILGSQRFHLGSGTRTANSERIRGFGLKGEVEFSPEDGAMMNLQNGDTVQLQSPEGALTREIRLEKGLRPGLVFVPTAFHGNDATNLLGLTPFENTQSQGFKMCQVKVRKMQGPKGREA